MGRPSLSVAVATAAPGQPPARRESASALACLFWIAASAGMVALGLDELVCDVLCCLLYVRGSEEIFERSSRRSLTWRRWRSLPVDGLDSSHSTVSTGGATPEFQSYAYRRLFGRLAGLADGLQLIGYGVLLVAPSWTALGLVAAWIAAHSLALASWERRLRRGEHLTRSDHPYRAPLPGGAPDLPPALCLGRRA